LVLSVVLALPLAARAEGDALLLPVSAFQAPQAQPLAQRRIDDDTWGRGYRRQVQARQGLLLSFGLGGGSMYLSPVGQDRTGAFDLDFRIGYGFSDRFQMFIDVGVDAGRHTSGVDLTSWTATLRGQTVLVGDRAGNGLNLNLGVGLGGVTYNSGYYNEASSPSGLAVAGGLSYDARVSPWFALSPELFMTWHEIPNGPGIPQDVASIYGFRLNFLWYLH
jgi:hypothetical protein